MELKGACTKRTILKSLVRENRTQGSVRGRSGNWPSYLDCSEMMEGNETYRRDPSAGIHKCTNCTRGSEDRQLGRSCNSICALYEINGYDYMNQAHVASLLYCLLIVPKEIWIEKDKAHPVLTKIDERKLRESFQIQLRKDPNFDSDFKYNLLHKLRNSVAHANYEIDENMNFTFWNESRGNITFRCKVTAVKLMLFLSEVGSVLANLRRKT